MPSTRRRSIDERFAEFHERNPHIYEQLRKTALAFKARGAKYLSVKLVYEYARVSHWLTTTSHEPWRLSNDYTSRYSRKLMAEVPELAGMFRTKSLKAESEPAEDLELDAEFWATLA